MAQRNALFHQLSFANILLLACAVLSVPLVRLDAALASAGQPGHWHDDEKELVIVDRTGDPAWHEATQWAVARWNDAGARIRLRWTTGSGPCLPDGARVSVCASPQAALQIHRLFPIQGVARSTIREGAHYGSSLLLVCSDCAIDAARRRVIATHEVGHSLGLPHSERASSVMFHAGGSETPDDGDVATLRAVYDHADAPLSCGMLNLRVAGFCL